MKSTGVELTMFVSSTPALDHIDFIQKSHVRKDKRLDIIFSIKSTSKFVKFLFKLFVKPG